MKMKIWMYLVIVVVILTIYALVGMSIRPNDRYQSWCNDLMIKCGYNPPCLKIMSGGKRSTIKKCDNDTYIYLSESSSERSDKKSLVYLMAHSISEYKHDAKYYSAVDNMLNESDIERLDVDCTI